MDSYHIMERRGRFRGSLWLGLGGLRWLVNVILKLCNLACTLDGFFEFFRDGYRVLEISCLSNRGGRFLDISEYHSGAHRGSIRLPEGRRGAGWSLFEFQVRKYFLCEIVVPEHRLESLRKSEEKLPAAGHAGNRNTHWRHSRQERNSRPFRNSARFAPILPKTDTIRVNEKRESWNHVELANNTPRPTRLSKFEWKPKSKTLRITLDSGSRRKVEWVGLASITGPKIIRDEGLPSCGPLIAEAQEPSVLYTGMVDGPITTKELPVHHFYVGEASGTKDTRMESKICDPTDDEDDSESESTGDEDDSKSELAEMPFVDSGGLLDLDLTVSGEDELRREPSGPTDSLSVEVELTRDENKAVNNL